MKHIKTVTTQEVVDFTTCDICGAKIEWQAYSINEVEVYHKKGSNCLESGSGTTTSIDMCGLCFDEKLVPWLCSQNAKPRIEEWSW